MSTAGRTMSLPTIQVLTPQRLRKTSSLQKQIADLLNQVKQLHDDTENIVCNCKRPDCPFLDSHQSPIEQSDSIVNLSDYSPKLRRKGVVKDIHPAVLKASPSLKGIDRRSDGTIVERDGPRTISGEDSLEKRLERSSMYSSASLGQHLSVSNTVISLSESDCLVDSDNLFGTSSDEDSTFSRFEPKRKNVRMTPRGKRRATMIPPSTSFPSQQPHVHRMSFSVASRQQQHQFSLHLRGSASLPSCVSYKQYFEDEGSLSTCSSSSSLGSTPQISCQTNHSRQHSGLMTTP